MVYFSGEHKNSDLGEINSKVFMKAVLENYVGKNSIGETFKIGNTYLKQNTLTASSGYFGSEALAS